MKYTVVIAFLLVLASLTVEAQRRAGGAGVRAGGAAHVNRDVASTSIRSNQDVNRNVNRNRDVNRNVSGDINVHRDVNVDAHYDRWGHPIALGAAAGVAAGVAGAATRAALGTTVAMLPSGCSTVIVDGIGYSQCGSTWYQPHYQGTTVQYIVVSPPQ